MTKAISIFLILVFSVIGLMSCSESQQNGIVEDAVSNADVKIMQSWQGDYPVDQLTLLPEGQRDQIVGYINDAETFSDIWNQFKPGANVPEINFETNLVFFVRNIQYYNRISIGKVTITNGVVDVLAMETMSAIPIEDNLALSLAVIPRKGITAIKIGDKQISID